MLASEGHIKQWARGFFQKELGKQQQGKQLLGKQLSSGSSQSFTEAAELARCVLELYFQEFWVIFPDVAFLPGIYYEPTTELVRECCHDSQPWKMLQVICVPCSTADSQQPSGDGKETCSICMLVCFFLGPVKRRFSVCKC